MSYTWAFVCDTRTPEGSFGCGIVEYPLLKRVDHRTVWECSRCHGPCSVLFFREESPLPPPYYGLFPAEVYPQIYGRGDDAVGIRVEGDTSFPSAPIIEETL